MTILSISLDKKDVPYAREFIEDISFIIERSDPAPTVFGVPMRPTLFRAISGYLVSVMGVVIAKPFGRLIYFYNHRPSLNFVSLIK